MYDTELSFHIVEQIRRAIQTIMDRFSTIKSVSDFTDTSRGMEKLDSICMLLIAIGESLKNLDKITHNELLKNYPEIDWKKAKGPRDIISHHYFDVNAEAIYDVCESKMPSLHETMKKILQDMKNTNQ
ncbi:MAG: antitoxin [Desulfobulbaceae bacterium DB1]|nr:MAG: antitoxin [Desulfobulbaceae bacterium DB1]